MNGHGVFQVAFALAWSTGMAWLTIDGARTTRRIWRGVGRFRKLRRHTSLDARRRRGEFLSPDEWLELAELEVWLCREYLRIEEQRAKKCSPQ